MSRDVLRNNASEETIPECEHARRRIIADATDKESSSHKE
jgi:hypothetical protein